MAQAYASNAEGVSDYLKNYTDEQINTVGEMVSNENNMALSEWRDKAEKLRAQGEANIESGGEALGGIIGIKGIGKGISKVKAIIKKGKEAKKTAEDLAKKAKEAVNKGKSSVEKIKNDLENKTKSKGDKAKENNEDPDIDEDPEAYKTTPFDDVDTSSKPPSTEQEGGDDAVNQGTGEGDAIGQQGGAVADDITTPESSPNLYESPSSERPALQERFDKLPQESQDKISDAIKNRGDDESVSDVMKKGLAEEEPKDLDTMFDQSTGGTEEGTFSTVQEATASTRLNIPRIGDGDVESVLQRPSVQQRTELNPDSAPTTETSFDNDLSQDVPESIGGESEMSVYKNTAPTEYTQQGATTESASAPAQSTAEGLDQGGNQSLRRTIRQPDKTLDLDSSQPDAPRPDVELDTLGSENDIEGATTPPDPVPTPKTDPDPTPDPTPDISADTGEPAGTDLGEYASKITSNLAKRGASIRQQASSAYQTVKKKITEEPEESGGGGGGDEGEDAEGEEADAGEEVAETGGEEATSWIGDAVVGAIPVVGELVAVGGALYGIYDGIEDLFGGKSSPPPPKTETVGTTLAGGNPLNFGDNSFANKLTTGIATHDDALDMAGSLSF